MPVDYETIGIHSLLSRCDSPQMPFEWTLNPYRGCAFSCRYCYARYTHEWLGLDPDADFDRRVLVKRDVEKVLERDLARLRRARAASARRRARTGGGGAGGRRRERIAMGTATDPYQPAEHRFGLSRACLQVFDREPAGLPREKRRWELSITTKSDLIVRDIPILQSLSRRNDIAVNVTLTTLDRDLSRKLEPGAPGPKTRLSTMATLVAAGIEVNAFAMPILPGLTDSEADLDALFASLAEAGVRRVVCEALFLRSPTREVFFRFLDDTFPELAAQYRRRFEESVYASPLYVERLRARVGRLRERYGLSGAKRSARGSSDRKPRLTNVTEALTPAVFSRGGFAATTTARPVSGGTRGRGLRLRRTPSPPRETPPISAGVRQLHLFDA